MFLATRNIRIIIAIVGLLTVIGLVASSHQAISQQLQKVKENVGDSIPFADEESEFKDNTLQGKPHKGPDAPYSPGKVVGAAGDATSGAKVGGAAINVAEPPPNDPPDITSPKSVNIGSVSVDKDGKPVIVADTSNSEKSHAKGLALEEQSNKLADAKPPSFKALGDAKPEVNSGCDTRSFVIMIDAGSTGSRVHIYEFNTCQTPPVLVQETFEMLKPGLSSFDTDTVGAATSLDPLLALAMKTVPVAQQGCTPVAVKATAGLRLLGEEKANNILVEVRRHLQEDFPFAVVDGDGISIMDGKDEGVYAWITTNYLLGNIGSSEKLPTAAVFDLGGGSTQIVFEPEFTHDETMTDGDHKYKMTFGNRDFILYQYSHLGYGLMQGRHKINGLIIENSLKADPKLADQKITDKTLLTNAKASVTLQNPCIPPGVIAENIQVDMGDNQYYVVNMKGPSAEYGVHAGAQCRFLAEKVLNKEMECLTTTCSFNGIYQPSLTKSFKHANDMYIFSYFYDRTNPLGFPSSFTVEELRDLAKVVCGGEAFWKDILLPDHIDELNQEPQWCLDLSFITAMLHTGYDIPLGRELKTAKTINSNELGWCLGASLPLLDKASGWTCRVNDITA